MIINKNSGDDLARIFQDLLNKNIKKTAAYHAKDGKDHCAEDHVHDASCMAEDDLADDAADKELDNAIEDMILDGDAKDINGDYSNDMQDDLDEEHFAADYVMDKEATNIMRGLGKIAGSLRSKNENFAADVVEATALSIRNDFVKEASDKRRTLNELEKMAERLDKKGNKKAAIEVIKTASKIAKS